MSKEVLYYCDVCGKRIDGMIYDTPIIIFSGDVRISRSENELLNRSELCQECVVSLNEVLLAWYKEKKLVASALRRTLIRRRISNEDLAPINISGTRSLTQKELEEQIQQLYDGGADPDEDRTFEDNLLRMLLNNVEETRRG